MRTFLDFIDPRKQFPAAYVAAQENHPKIIRLLHEMRADLEKPNTAAKRGTPTGIAAQNGQTAMVQLLSDLGADIHRPTNGGARPIHTAAGKGHDKTVLLLLSMRAGADSTDNTGLSVLMYAAAHATPGQLSVIRVLIEAGVNVGYREPKGFTAADMDRKYGNHAAQVLLESGASKGTGD